MEALETRTVLSATPINLDLNIDGGSNPSDFVQVGDLWYFVADDGTNGRELWRTDGTDTGTELVVNIASDSDPGDSSFPSELVSLDGMLYFAADDGDSGLELWESDGTAEGTVLVSDINTDSDGAASSSPQNLTVVGDKIYFTADDGDTGQELWMTDGTDAGTVLVRDIYEGTDPYIVPTELTVLDGVLYFVATSEDNGRELWTTDGTAEGTVIVKEINEETSGSYGIGSYPALLTLHDGEIYFIATDGENGTELWKTDGTEDGTLMVADISEGETSSLSNYDSMVSNGDYLIFTANDGVVGSELWRSDGTEAGTLLVRDIDGGASGNLFYQTSLTAIDGIVYFSANDGENGAELWMTDGTSAGTVMVADISPGSTNDEDNPVAYSSYPTNFQVVDGVIYFSAYTPQAGRELWTTDGTAEGTYLVEDLIVGTVGSYPTELTNVNGTLFYSANEVESKELFALVDEDDFTLTVVIDSEFFEIPADIGVEEDGSTAELYTVSDTGQILFDADSGLTLGDFFEVWETDAGLAGDNSDAILSSTELLGNETDFDNTLQMFVNGELVKDFENYVVQDDDDIVLVYGPNTVVAIQTNYGPIIVELFDDDTPETVENFLEYVNSGAYIDTIFHRSVTDFVIQGGGYSTDSTTFEDDEQFEDVEANDPVINEPGISNTQGTIAMAKLGDDPNSATNEFFFNLEDNSENLDEQNEGFTVFGQVLGMTTVDAIAALPTTNGNTSTSEGPFTDLPLGPAEELVVIEDIVGYGDVTGVKYLDVNGNEVLDGEDALLEGVIVYVDLNNNGVRDVGEDYTVTDSEGRYRLQVEPGTYTLRAEVSDGGTGETIESYTIDVEIGEELSGRNFGEEGIEAPTSIDLVSTSDTGVSDDDNITSNNNASEDKVLQFTISGVAEGAEVRVYADGVLIDTVVADSSVIVYTTDGLNAFDDGVVEFTATQFLNGLESDPAPALNVEIDATGPSEITTTAPEFATVGETYTYDADSDSEGEAGVTYSLVGAPDGMTINALTGEVLWTPEEEDAVPQEFQIVLSDTAGNSAIETVDLTILTDFPALPDVYEIDEDTTLTVDDAAQGVLANDGDDDSVVVSAELVEGPENGTLEFFSDGTFVYTPDPDFFGTDSFTYIGVNGADETNVAKVTIEVQGVQDAPVGVADAYVIDEDEVLSPAVEEGLLANDSDVDGDLLTAIVDTQPTNGTVTVNADGTFTYTPDAEFSGADSFTYTVSDGNSTSPAPITVDITVNEVDDTPTGVADFYTLDEDTVLAIAAAQGVLANDIDPDSTDLVGEIISQPENGTLVFLSDGSFTYEPDNNFFGEDTFTYTVSDGNTTSAETTVTFTVNNVGDPPDAVDDVFEAQNDGTEYTFSPLDNDTSPDVGEVLTLVSVEQGPEGGTVQISGNQIIYLAAEGFVGSETFSYTIEDEDGLTSSASITVEVTEAFNNSISGYVYLDVADFGVRNTDEIGIPGVLITLTGFDANDNFVIRTTMTRDNGYYEISDLPSGEYDITQTQPSALIDGVESTTIPDARVGNDEILDIVLGGGDEYQENNFGEQGLRSEYYSIRWFFASSIDPQEIFRIIVAAAEYNEGNTEFAEQIREGEIEDTNPDDDDSSDNTIPVAVADSYSALENEELEVLVEEGVLINDSDADGQSLAAILISEPEEGTLRFEVNGSFTYTPDPEYTGTDSFTYVAFDGLGNSLETTVTITIIGVNDEPLGVEDLYGTSEDITLTVDEEDGVLSNDEDNDSTLTAVLLTTTQNGSLALEPDGSFIYTPNEGFVGTDTFVYQAFDGELFSEDVTVTLEVLETQELTIDVDSDNGTVAGTVAVPSSLSDPVVFEIVDDSLPAELQLVADDHLSGSTSGKIVLIEYIDLQCPACQLYHSIVEELKIQFGDDLLVVTRHLPLTSSHPNALEAAIVAEAAGRQGMFDEMVDLLFERQDDWEDLDDPTSLFASYAEELGLDTAQFATDVVDPELEERVQRDADTAADLGLASTPSVFLDGILTTETTNLTDAAEQIQAALDTNDDVFTIDRVTGEVILVDSDALGDASSHELAVRTTDIEGVEAVVTVAVNVTGSATTSAIAVSATESLLEEDVEADSTDALDSVLEDTEEWLYAV